LVNKVAGAYCHSQLLDLFCCSLVIFADKVVNN
jgi:hypothetical protein